LKVQAKERTVKFLAIITMNIKQRWSIKVYRSLPLWTYYTGIQENVCQTLSSFLWAVFGWKMLCQHGPKYQSLHSHL
jgi:hypothetical protein